MPEDKLATQDNALIASSYRMTLDEKRLLALAISQLDDRLFTRDEIRFAESQKLHGITGQVTVPLELWTQTFPDRREPGKALQKALKKLFERSWSMTLPDGGWRKGRWLESVAWLESEEQVVLGFANCTAELLHEFKNKFVQYSVAEIGPLNSFNQVRLFEMFLAAAPRSGGSGYLEIKREDLYQRLAVKESTRWAIFNRDTLRPALAAINKNTNISVELIARRKVRRAIHALTFQVSDKDQLELDV